MKMRVGQGFLSASDATATDITWAGLGVPDACMIFATGAEVIDTNDARMQACIGYTDFTTDVCCVFSNNNSSVPDNYHGMHSRAFAMPRFDAASFNRTVAVTAITDGVRCTTLEAGNPYGFMVVAFFGGEWKAFQVINDSTALSGTIDVAHTLSGEPNLGFIGFDEISAIDTMASTSRWSFGMFTNKLDVIVQYCMMHFATGNPVFANGLIHNDKVGGGLNSGATIDQSIKLTSVDGTNLTFTVEDSAMTGDSFCGLVGLITEDVDLVLENSPDSTSVDWNVNGASFLPQGVIGMMNEFDIINAGETNNTAGLFSCFAFDNAGTPNKHSTAWMVDDGSGSSGSPTTQRSADRVSDDFVLITDDESLNYRWANPTLTADGFDVANADITAVDVVTHLWPMMFIGEDASGVVINRVLTSTTAITDPVPGTILRQRIPGDRVELLSDGVFLYTALGRLLFENFEVNDAIVLKGIIDNQLLETSNLSDALSIMRQVFRQVSTAIAVGDNVNTSVALARLSSDSLSSSDSLAQLLERQRVVGDSVSLSDFFSKIVTVGESQQTFAVLLEEILNIEDTPQLAFHGINNREFSDTLSLSEALTLNHIRYRVALSEAGVIDSALANAVRHQQTLDTLSNTDALVPVRRRNVTPSISPLSTSDLTDLFSIRDRSLFLNQDELSEVVIDDNSLTMNDDILVTRTAILNSTLSADTISLVDFLRASSGTLLPPADICIEHGIQNQ